MDDLAAIIEQQEADERDRLERIELRLHHGDLPMDPRQRIHHLASGARLPDDASAVLLQVVIHASTALRCRTRVLEALADRSVPGASIRAIGEANMGALALYLAAEACQRFCIDEAEPGPLGRARLDAFVLTAEHMRDCVIHWRDKARAPAPAFLEVTEHDILVVGMARDRRATVAVLSWKRFEEFADRLRRWSQYKLAERLTSLDPASEP